MLEIRLPLAQSGTSFAYGPPRFGAIPVLFCSKDTVLLMKGLLKHAAVALAMAATATGASAAEKLKVGFIYVGPVGDFGDPDQHDQGRQAMAKALGDKVETTFLENVPENDSERSIEQLARTGHKLIFTTSFGFMEPTLKVAKKYPNVKFEHATGFKRAPNVATYSARFYEGRYVIGQIAGKMTKSNTIGYIPPSRSGSRVGHQRLLPRRTSP